MKMVRNVTDFYIHNDKDICNFIRKFFPKVLEYYDIEDIKNEIYERLHRKEYVQKYAPLYIGVDIENNTWEIKRSKAKFSTYIYTFVKNYVWSYYNTIKPDELHVSLEAYSDSGYDEKNNRKINMLESVFDHFKPTIGSDLKIELLNKLEKLKENNKGTLVLDQDIEVNITKFIETFGDKGCSEKKLIKKLSNSHANKNDISGLEKLLIDKKLESIEKKGIIKSVHIENENGKTEKVFFVDNPERRSLHNLLKYYLKGYRDKEISEKFKMTVAGVGAMKRSLRKELKELRD